MFFCCDGLCFCFHLSFSFDFDLSCQTCYCYWNRHIPLPHFKIMHCIELCWLKRLWKHCFFSFMFLFHLLRIYKHFISNFKHLNYDCTVFIPLKHSLHCLICLFHKYNCKHFFLLCNFIKALIYTLCLYLHRLLKLQHGLILPFCDIL